MKAGTKLFVIQARVVPKVTDGWESSGRGLPTFWVWAMNTEHAESLARDIVSGLNSADYESMSFVVAVWTADVVIPVQYRETITNALRQTYLWAHGKTSRIRESGSIRPERLRESYRKIAASMQAALGAMPDDS